MMLMELQCPKCKTFFQVEESVYAELLQQVRNSEFEAEVARRMKEMQSKYELEGKAKALAIERDNEKTLAAKELEVSRLQQEIERLNTVVANFESGKKAEIALLQQQTELAVMKERESCKDAMHAREQQISDLSAKLETQSLEAKNRIHDLTESHNAVLKAKEEELERYKDLKSRLSTKMLGETLEQHCQTMFDRARNQGLFQTAYFEKDNDTSISGTKGDFIFRDYVNGEEYISIMFEMKNEADTTVAKHHNRDFFEKLDKDRKAKHCEYAVLVSMLESDNELYNEGIVDVSYLYDKMLVIRPQFFMAVIMMLSRTAQRGAHRLMSLKQELETVKQQSVDVSTFEERRDAFAAAFKKLVEGHATKQNAALDSIDKAIAAAEKQAEDLRKVKSLFEKAQQLLDKANDKVENDFTIRKLTRGNPTMKAKFEEARKLREQEALKENSDEIGA
jgi:hypothetical protein